MELPAFFYFVVFGLLWQGGKRGKRRQLYLVLKSFLVGFSKVLVQLLTLGTFYYFPRKDTSLCLAHAICVSNTKGAV